MCIRDRDDRQRCPLGLHGVAEEVCHVLQLDRCVNAGEAEIVAALKMIGAGPVADGFEAVQVPQTAAQGGFFQPMCIRDRVWRFLSFIIARFPGAGKRKW